MGESLTYISQKVNRVRWVPTKSSLKKSENFATGSYEDPERNSVDLWGTGHMTKTKSSDWFEMADFENSQPRRISSYVTNGEVRGMEFADSETLVVGLSSGNVVLLKVELNQQLIGHYLWESVHKFGGSTGVAVDLPEIVSVGEDGSVHQLRVENKVPVRSFAHADSCPITSVIYLDSHDVCTTNTMGQLRVWDLRSAGDTPDRIIVATDSLTALLSIDRHPSQNHIIATGSADGCVTVFDIRQSSAPVTRLQIHDEDVWEVRFHPDSPSNVFTCSEDGCVRRLNSSFEIKSLAFGSSQVEVVELLSYCGSSVNSLDIDGNRLLCSTDSESIYIFDSDV